MSDKEMPITIKVFPETREKLRMTSTLAKEGHMELLNRLVTKEHDRLIKKLIKRPPQMKSNG